MIKSVAISGILTLLAATLAEPVGASEWWFAGQDVNESSYFVDMTTFTRDATSVTYWSQAIFAKITDNIAVRKSRYKDTCGAGQRTTMFITSSNFSPTGEYVTGSTPPVPKPTLVVPDSVGETVNHFVCATSAERSKLGFKVVDTAAFAKGILKENTPPE